VGDYRAGSIPALGTNEIEHFWIWPLWKKGLIFCYRLEILPAGLPSGKRFLKLDAIG
jgi:hypothetical protein